MVTFIIFVTWVQIRCSRILETYNGVPDKLNSNLLFIGFSPRIKFQAYHSDFLHVTVFKKKDTLQFSVVKGKSYIVFDGS